MNWSKTTTSGLTKNDMHNIGVMQSKMCSRIILKQWQCFSWLRIIKEAWNETLLDLTLEILIQYIWVWHWNPLLPRGKLGSGLLPAWQNLSTSTPASVCEHACGLGWSWEATNSQSPKLTIWGNSSFPLSANSLGLSSTPPSRCQIPCISHRFWCSLHNPHASVKLRNPAIKKKKNPPCHSLLLEFTFIRKP